ncbi:MAG: ATP-binding cassette domain-containing protein [Spirochaetaceae bacterium]
MTESLIRTRDVTLETGGTRILDRISLEIRPGEVHALVGEHGAGKTSLCNILAGVTRPTSGHLVVEGRPEPIYPVGRARTLGIELVSQHTPLFENVTIAENIHAIVRNSMHRFRLFPRYLRHAREFLSKYDLHYDPEMLVRDLNPSDRTLLDIVRHVAPGPRLLLLDESFDKLRTEDLHKVFALIQRIKAKGTAVFFVTHRVDDIFHIADRVSVLNGGRFLVTESTGTIDKLTLVKLAYTKIHRPRSPGISNEEYYRLVRYNEAILQGLPVSLMVVDSSLSIRFLNPVAATLLGVTDTTRHDHTLDKVLGPQNAQTLNAVRAAVAASATTQLYDLSLMVNGSSLRVNIAMEPLFDESFPIGHILMIQDITEREALRERIMVTEKVASVGLLSAGVAHEINNPLEAIHNLVECLKFDPEATERNQIIEAIEEEVSSISVIVGNLKSFSERGQTGTEVFDINSLIADLLRLIRYNAEYNNINVRFLRNPETLPVLANRTEVKQVVLNVLKNSIDVMPNGGSISINSRSDSDKSSGVVNLTFRDTGPGIPTANPNDIFLPFFSTKTAKGHSGLGLSVSYGIVKKYGGTMEAGNLEPTGCQISIKLPSVSETQVRAESG